MAEPRRPNDVSEVAALRRLLVETIVAGIASNDIQLAAVAVAVAVAEKSAIKQSISAL